METLKEAVVRAVSQALREDLGTGDVTGETLIPPGAAGRARIVVREAGVVAGLFPAEETFRQVSSEVRFVKRVAGGDVVSPGAVAAEVSGPVRALLAGERVALNFLQRLSGIATLTRRCVEAVKGRPTQILDTRKTTPGLRALEKHAVLLGGGVNHRMGLFDQVLIKDNHLAALLPEAGDIGGAVRLAVARAREGVPSGMLIEVETESLDMVAAAIEARTDIIMLDNMPLDLMAKAVRLVRADREARGAQRPTTEASGGLKVEDLAAVAATGVDAISLGMLTHSPPSLDIAMDFA